MEGHNWGDDFGLYLQLADNIRSGRPYNSLNTGIQIPPGFPVILAGWEALFGQSFVALKTLNIAAWLIAAWMAYILANKTLGRLAAFVVLTAHFLLPSYYYQQQSVLSDPTFVAFVNLLLLLCYVYFRDLRDGKGISLPLLVSIPVVLFCALLIRPAGLPLAAVIIFVAILEAFLSWRNHVRVLRALGLAAGVVVTFGIYMAMFGASVVRPTGVHVSYALCEPAGADCSVLFGLSRMVARRAFEELLNLNVLLAWFPADVPTALMLVAGIIVGAIAYVVLTRDFVVPSFAAAYVGLLLIVPWQQGYRFLLPLASVIFLFFLSPLGLFVQYLKRGSGITRGLAAAGSAASLLFLIVVGVGMAGGMRNVHGLNDDETNDPRTKAVVAWLAQNTTPDDLLCSFKPRAMMYFVGRKTCGMPFPDDVQTEVFAFLKSQQASYAVLILRPPYGYRQLDERLRSSAAVTEVFRNEDYAVYKLIGSD